MNRILKVVCLLVALAAVAVSGAFFLFKTGSFAAAITQPPAPPPPPVADFTGQPTMGAEPLIVQFYDQSSAGVPQQPDQLAAPITSWLWNFGDGQTSSARYPSHTYFTEGIYHVSLKVTDADGRTATARSATGVVVDAGAAPGGLTVTNLRITPAYVVPGQAVSIHAHVCSTVTATYRMG